MSVVDVDIKWDTRSLNKAFKELEDELTAIVRGMTVKVWDSILIKTPQFSGGMAASWTYSLNAPQFYDRSDQLNGIGRGVIESGRYVAVAPRYRGHREAMVVANANSAGAEVNFKLGDIVYIANGADHGEGPYSAAVESGAVPLRAVNLPGTPAKRSIDMIGSRYGVDVSRRAAEQMKATKIGGTNAS